jgi:hypothetical protein
MESVKGELQYVSDGSTEVCGLYLIGQPNEVVVVAFLEFNVNCETGGVLAVCHIFNVVIITNCFSF